MNVQLLCYSTLLDCAWILNRVVESRQAYDDRMWQKFVEKRCVQIRVATNVMGDEFIPLSAFKCL